jgi:hypothetical protein
VTAGRKVERKELERRHNEKRELKRRSDDAPNGHADDWEGWKRRTNRKVSASKESKKNEESQTERREAFEVAEKFTNAKEIAQR